MINAYAREPYWEHDLDIFPADELRNPQGNGDPPEQGDQLPVARINRQWTRSNASRVPS